MKTIKIVLLVFVLSVFGQKGMAQQLPQFTQFADARLYYNPANAGTGEGINASLLGKWQWTGFEGGPNTQAFSIDGRVPNKNIGLGLSFIKDEIAVTDNTVVQLAYTYQIPVGNGTLSMGLNPSLTQFRSNESNLNLLSPDPNFTNVSKTSFNFGTGLYYSSEKWWGGVSVPYILNNKFEEGGASVFEQKQHLYITAGANLTLNEYLDLFPSALFRYVGGAPTSTEANVVLWYNSQIGFGGGLRSDGSGALILQARPTKDLKFGYAYEDAVGGDLSRLGGVASHEVMISYTLNGLFKAKKDGE